MQRSEGFGAGLNSMAVAEGWSRPSPSWAAVAFVSVLQSVLLHFTISFLKNTLHGFFALFRMGGEDERCLIN